MSLVPLNVGNDPISGVTGVTGVVVSRFIVKVMVFDTLLPSLSVIVYVTLYIPVLL